MPSRRVRRTMGIKDIRRNYILDRTIKLFCETSISEIKIKDVAQYCNIGEATFYRYFSKRSSLVVACALKLQERICELFMSEENGNGFEKLSRFFYRYYEVFGDHPEYYRFLSEFDSYCISAEITDLELYANKMNVFRDKFVEAYREGLADGSVKEVWDLDLFYYATTHAMLSLCKKLAAEAYIIKQDSLTDKRQEVRTIIEIILNTLRK